MFSNALIPIFCTEEIRQMPKDFSGAPGDAKVPPFLVIDLEGLKCLSADFFLTISFWLDHLHMLLLLNAFIL